MFDDLFHWRPSPFERVGLRDPAILRIVYGRHNEMDAIRWSTTSLAIFPLAEVTGRFDRANNDPGSRIGCLLSASARTGWKTPRQAERRDGRGGFSTI